MGNITDNENKMQNKPKRSTWIKIHKGIQRNEAGKRAKKRQLGDCEMCL